MRMLSPRIAFALVTAATLFLAGCGTGQPNAGRNAPKPARNAAAYAPPSAPQPYCPPATPPEYCPPAPVAPAAKPLAARTVILDAGHGGSNLGADYFGIREKDVNLDVTLRAARMLRARGVSVELTRQNDVFVPLPERSAFANRRPNAVFVSIHSNAAPSNPQATGIESFILSPQFTDAERSRTAAGRFRVNGQDTAQSGEALANLATKCRSDSKVLAQSLQRSMVARMGDGDRGVKTANLAVLRETYFCPAVLVEMGFLTNRASAARMATAAWRERAADAISQGILDYLQRQ